MFSHRTYPADPGFSNLLGYVSYPLKDKDGFYWQSDFVGKAGIEEEYDDSLKGANGTQVIERDAFGHVISENTTNPPVQGNNLTLTIDADVQSNLYEKMDAVAHANNYQGGAGIMIDIHTGEIIALTSYPEYNSEILSEGIDTPVIQGYLNDPQKPFLNRAIDGLYSPGSIFKPIVALGALKEGVIDPLTKLLSFGSISVPNPYAPGQNTIFKDYAADNGLVDMRNALRVSSNIYFYEIGGGYKSQKGIGIANIQKYAAMFGLGAPSGIDLPDEKAGVIPGPEWKALHFPGDPWRIGDTYHTAIGQYGVQVTPIQMARVVSAIANGGTLVTPHVVIDPSIPIPAPAKLPFPDSDFNVIREGMRLVATVGTAKSFNNLPFKLAAKTGTAQVGVNNEFINSWTMTFFPYDAPRYALVVMMERGPATNTVGSQLAAHDFLDWLGTYKPEYVSVK